LNQIAPIADRPLSQPDGLDLARARIMEEAQRKTGRLDLCNLGLTALPPELFMLSHLNALFLGDGIRREDGSWVASTTHGPANQVTAELHLLAAIPSLRELSVAGAELDSLEKAGQLTQLQAFDCARTQVTDLAPLSAIARLRQLDISGTQVVDLGPVASLPDLRTVNCSYTPVGDLGPLGASPSLRQLDCSSTEVTDLTPLAQLKTLVRLDCSYAPLTELGPLAQIASLQHLVFGGTQIADLGPLATLGALAHIDCSFTQVSDLTPLSQCNALQWLNCAGTQVADLAPLSGLKGLRVLFCSDTQVADLRPLANLSTLRALECSHTQISDLAPLSSIPMLQVLHCSGTQVADLAPLAPLTSLQVLYCSGTKVTSLAPIAGLTNLQVLSCAHTGITELEAVANFPSLREFSCADTAVGDLRPLSRLGALQWLSCSNTRVADLAPLTGKGSLKWVSCAASPVRDLAPIASMTGLQRLDGSDCRLGPMPANIAQLENLQELYLYRSTVENIPAEVLSQSKRDNCLASLRAHFEDLAEGAETVPDVKLVILGNGRVGKTQLSRKLRDEDFQEHWDSTHGVSVRPGALAHANGETAARLQIWDFGGQDIYHGTHTLFLRTRAVFVIAWAQDVENTPEYEHQGIRFRNHPLAYWLEYVRQFGDPDSPVLIVQTKADSAADDLQDLPIPAEELSQFGYLRVLRYSSANDRGRAELNAALAEAIDWMRDPSRQGNVSTGAVRARVRRQLEALRDKQENLPAAQRQYRTLPRETFLSICQDAGGVGSVEQLLSYLNNAGTIFYRPDLFDGQIILDQGGALDAIYAVFQRDKSYRQLQSMEGRFTRSDLANLVWRDYAVGEQRLFLSMMLSCGICFILSGHGPDDETTVYAAPDLLPEQDAVQAELDARWNILMPGEYEAFTYKLVPPSLLRSLIARIGSVAGPHAVYWRRGVCVYEASLRAHALIAEEPIGEWGGRISMHAQGGAASILLERLTEWIEEEHDRAGLDPHAVTRASRKFTSLDDDPIAAILAMTAKQQTTLDFGPPPNRMAHA